MLEVQTKHVYVLTIDKSAFDAAESDICLWVALHEAIASFKATETTARTDGSYFKTERTF